MEAEREAESENILGTAPIRKLLRQFALPSVISMVVNALYNIVDQIFIGRGVGYLGNGGTNVIMPYMVLCIGFGLLFGDGCAAYFSMEMGRGNQKEASRGVANAVVGMVVVGVIMGAVCSIFNERLCWLTGATETLLPYAMEYGSIIFLGFPFSMYSAGTASLIRADGSPRWSMAGLMTGCIVNIVLDYVFVFPLGMGMSGAALATIIGQGLNAFIYFLYMFRFKNVTLKKSYWKPSLSYMKRITRLGISSMVTQISVVIIMIVTNRVMTKYGADSIYGSEIPMTAFGIVQKVNNILTSIMIGIGAGALPIIGYNFGAQKYDRVKKTILMSVGAGMLCGLVATFFFQFMPETILSIFGTESDLYMEFAVKAMRIFLMLCILDGMNNVIPTCFQAVGKPGYSACASLMRNVGFNVPPILILPIFVGVIGALWNGPIAMAASFVMNVILVRKLFKELDHKAAAGANA